MITSLKIKNFQCWPSLELELERITVLVAENEKGKSSALRALKWCLLNEWDGAANDFITWGQDSSEVTVGKDGHEIVRQKGKTINNYALDGLTYLDIGTKVPEEVAKIVNLTLDNFQNQQDDAYWLMLNPADAARALNELFNLDIIDTTTTAINSELRAAKSKVSECQDRLKEAKQTVEELDWLDKAETNLKELEVIQEQIDKIDKDEKRIAYYCRQLIAAEQIQQGAAAVIEAGQNVLVVVEVLEKATTEINQLTELIQWQNTQASLAKALKTKQDQLSKLLDKQCPLCRRTGKVPQQS